MITSQPVMRCSAFASDVIDQLPKLRYQDAYARQVPRDKFIGHQAHIRERGKGVVEVGDWW